jgi:hypothetical protein
MAACSSTPAQPCKHGHSCTALSQQQPAPSSSQRHQYGCHGYAGRCCCYRWRTCCWVSTACHGQHSTGISRCTMSHELPQGACCAAQGWAAVEAAGQQSAGGAGASGGTPTEWIAQGGIRTAGECPASNRFVIWHHPFFGIGTSFGTFLSFSVLSGTGWHELAVLQPQV